jgi:hypothetical protein
MKSGIECLREKIHLHEVPMLSVAPDAMGFLILLTSTVDRFTSPPLGSLREMKVHSADKTNSITDTRSRRA